MNEVRHFLERSVHHLREEYLPRIETAVEALPSEDLWWRPHPEATSVGNLLLHLEGNVRQWILTGLGGDPDHRRRSEEFAAESGEAPAALVAHLRTTVEAACEVILAVEPAEVLELRPIQCFEETTMAAIYHVVEHFAWHTGQITYIAKQRAGAGHGVSFYEGLPLDQTGESGGSPG